MEFYRSDNIDYEKFECNLNAEVIIDSFGSIENWKFSNEISMDKVELPKINPTPTFKKHFSNSLIRDIPLGFGEWFYLAYPDVIIWFRDNHKRIEEHVEQNEQKYGDEDGPKAAFYRFLINEYKKHQKLECSI